MDWQRPRAGFTISSINSACKGRWSPAPCPTLFSDKAGIFEVQEEFLLRIVGEDQVTKFTIEEIVSVSTTLADYVKKENLTVKENKVKTIQTIDELRSIFVPGNDFGFNATLELENSTEDEEIESSAEDEELESSTEHELTDQE